MWGPSSSRRAPFLRAQSGDLLLDRLNKRDELRKQRCVPLSLVRCQQAEPRHVRQDADQRSHINLRQMQVSFALIGSPLALALSLSLSLSRFPLCLSCLLCGRQRCVLRRPPLLFAFPALAVLFLPCRVLFLVPRLRCLPVF